MDAADLKLKVIKEFDRWFYRMAYGHQEKYNHILDMISLIEEWNDIDNIAPIYEYLINNGFTKK